MGVWRKGTSLLTAAALMLSAVFTALPAVAESTTRTIDSVQVNQAGYITGQDKTFVVSRTEKDAQSVAFSLQDSTTGKAVYTGVMTKEETPYAGTANEWPQTYYVGDFSGFDQPGRYTITVTCGDETAASCAFSIGDAVSLYSQPLYATLAYFRGERDTGNTAIKNQYNGDQPIDLHGAWYDASNRPAVYVGYIDNYNYMTCPVEGNTSYQLFSAYEAAPSLYDGIDYNHNGTADILEEAVWGCDWYVRLKPQELTGGYFYNGPEHGKIHSNESVKTPVAIRMGTGTAIAALAKAARYGIDGDFTAEEYGLNAKQAWDWYIKNNASQACEDGMEHLMDDIYWAVAGLEMYRTFQEQAYLDKAISSIDAVLARQTGDDRFEGWFELGMEADNPKQEGGPYHNWLDEAAVLYPLIGYAQLCPEDTARVASIKTAVKDYMDFKLALSEETGANPYGYAKQYFRHDVGDPDSTLTRFFQNETGHATSPGPNTKGWTSGENGRLLSLLYASLLADEFLGTDDYLSYGLNQLNWVYGVNPYAAVMQCGIGDGRNLAEEIGHGGTVPYGAFINGIRGNYKEKITYDTGYSDSKDIPFIDQSYWTGEWFLPIGTDAIVALTKLMATVGDTVLLPKNVPCEAENAEYLLTAEKGSNKGNKSFAVQAQNIPDASGGRAVTGINEPNEGVIWLHAPKASSITLRYAAENGGTIHLYVGGRAQEIELPATGSGTTFASVSTWASINDGDSVAVQFAPGDTAVTLDYLLFNDITVASAEHTLATTLAGNAPALPEAVTVTYSDGSTGRETVEWDNVNPADYARPGTFSVSGRLGRSEREVTATITVYDRADTVWIEPTRIATPVGTVPRLPETVTVYYPNGAALPLPVAWNTPDTSAYAAAGEVTIVGTVEGLDGKAQARITVLDPFPDGVSDLAFGKTVSASGSNSVNDVSCAVDGNLATRWESTVNGDEHQWLEIDLGKTYTVGAADIFWETAFASEYRLSVSEDRTHWTELYYTDASDGGEDSITFDEPGKGRYLRLDCLTRGYAGWRAYSLYEIRVFSAASADPYIPAEGLEIVSGTSVLCDNGQAVPLKVLFTPAAVSIDEVLWTVSAPDGQPTDCASIDYTGVLKAHKDGLVKVTARAVDGSGAQGSRLFLIKGQSGGNLALNKTATAQYSHSATENLPAAAVDGRADGASRWSGKWGEDDQWFQVDLGQAQPINRVTINWENAYSSSYELSVSTNGEQWTPVYTQAKGAGGIETADFDAVSARYVRLHSTKSATSYGISIWEFEVYYAPSVSATAEDVARTLAGWPAPVDGGERLALPVQPGYTISLHSISAPEVLSADGTVTPPAEDTPVSFRFRVVSEENPEDTADADVTLTIPGIGTEGAALHGELAALEAFEQQEAYRQGSPLLVSRYHEARRVAQEVWAKGNHARPLAGLAAGLLKEAREALLQADAVVMGDVNTDGEITAEDALMALQAATKKITLTPQQTLAADVDRQDGVTAADALRILQYVTKKIAAF